MNRKSRRFEKRVGSWRVGWRNEKIEDMHKKKNLDW